MRKVLFFVVLTLFLLGFIRFAGGEFFQRLSGFSGEKEVIKPLPDKDPAVELAKGLAEKKIHTKASPVATESAFSIILSESDTEVLFAGNKDIATQINSLQIILAELTIEARVVRRIDLRFSDPIVLY